MRIETEGKVLMIDCTPDFRQQLMPLPFDKIDAILFTHEHYDHTGGIDDLRPFSLFGTVRLYMEERMGEILKQRIPYCFATEKYKGVPDITIHPINVKRPFSIEGIKIIPIRVMHYRLPILGFRIGDFVYMTDVKTIPESEFPKLQGVKTLVISALRKKEHLSHQTLDKALTMVERLQPERTYLIHMSHEMGLHTVVDQELPPSVHLAHDGLEIIT